jgi:acyl-CoA:acyl-CoA alkyltransferase
MRYERVCLEAFGYTLPDEIITSAEIESRLAPLYQRLRLPEGRLELMTGIRERRFWPSGTLPSEISIQSAEKAIAAAGIDNTDIGCLIHASVCRDHLEPATACRVHHGLGLSGECLIYDTSNACLGILNGMLQVANMIELGQIKAGLIVGTESSRPLVENTIARLNSDISVTREQMKLAVASLTIGSGSAAVLLVNRELSRTQNRLAAAVARANTQFHALCHSGGDESIAGGMQPWMTTDSERLLHAGVATANDAFADFLAELGCDADGIDKVFCHQVGVAHRRLLYETLRLPPPADFSTVEFLGNTGSVAAPITAAIGIERGQLSPGDRFAMLGIGSGLNVIMLGVEWQMSAVVGDHLESARDRRHRGRGEVSIKLWPGLFGTSQ